MFAQCESIGWECFYFPSVAVIRHSDQKQLGESKGFGLHLQFMVHHRRKSEHDLTADGPGGGLHRAPISTAQLIASDLAVLYS